jgi:hypothetical protein
VRLAVHRDVASNAYVSSLMSIYCKLNGLTKWHFYALLGIKDDCRVILAKRKYEQVQIRLLKLLTTYGIFSKGTKAIEISLVEILKSKLV